MTYKGLKSHLDLESNGVFWQLLPFIGALSKKWKVVQPKSMFLLHVLPSEYATYKWRNLFIGTLAKRWGVVLSKLPSHV